MQTTLAATALLMGLAGGPHCIAMCGAACAGIARAGSGVGAAQSNRSLWLFQAGRVAGYSALGAMAAASMQGLGWLTAYSAALRPVWTLFHVAAAMMGLVLLWQARQPIWLEHSASKVWRSVRGFAGAANGGPSSKSQSATSLLIGVVWALLPCGLLYSALLVAAMSASVQEGAAVMALFALGSGVSLIAGPWFWLKLAARPPVPRLDTVQFHTVRGDSAGHGPGKWGIRIAGLALFATSGWALWMGLIHGGAPWCLTP